MPCQPAPSRPSSDASPSLRSAGARLSTQRPGTRGAHHVSASNVVGEMASSLPTAFTELVGCELPLQLAPMTGIVTPALAAAVSNAGGLGMVPAGRRGVEPMRKQLDGVAALTSHPFGAGLLAEFLDDGLLELVAELAPVVELFWGEPDPALVPDGPIVGWQVGSPEHARAAVEAGCAYVVAQGVEAGGHVHGTTPLAELLPTVRAAVDVPVVAAGGIGSAETVREAFALGADAVRIGTRFVAAAESDAHDRYVELLSQAGDGDTVFTEAFGVGWPDAPHRVLASALAAAESAPDVVGRSGEQEIPRFFVSSPTRSVEGNIDAMALYAGEGSTRHVSGRVPAAEIIRELLG